MAVLNVFKTFPANVSTTATTVYTAPSGYTTVVLLAQIANNGTNTFYANATHVRSGVPTTIISNTAIPVNDTVNLLSGKLILQTSDSITISGSEIGRAHV